MIRQCAWCMRILGEVAPLKDTSVSHGICEECSKDMMKEIERIDEKIRKAS